MPFNMLGLMVDLECAVSAHSCVCSAPVQAQIIQAILPSRDIRSAARAALFFVSSRPH